MRRTAVGLAWAAILFQCVVAVAEGPRSTDYRALVTLNETSLFSNLPSERVPLIVNSSPGPTWPSGRG